MFHFYLTPSISMYSHMNPLLIVFQKSHRSRKLCFKKTLEVTAEKSREIERNTREQRKYPLWFSVRRDRITASIFGAVLSRKPDTPPDCLVLSIIQSKSFSTPATEYGIEKEESAVKEYISHQHNHGHHDLMVTASGVMIVF